MSEGWEWELTERGRSQFESLDGYARERIAAKLDDVVDDPWRDPTDHLEPLAGVPHQKLRVGPFRLGVRADRNAAVLYVLAIRKRGADAYRDDD